MTNARSLIALAVLAASTSLAFAQPAASPSRADVKADARAAVKAGTTDEGDLSVKGPGRVTKTEGMSGTSRTQVQADAKQAAKAGTTAEGDRGGPAYSGRDRAEKAQSTATRAEVKAGATSAISAPAGEPKTLNTDRTIPGNKR